MKVNRVFLRVSAAAVTIFVFIFAFQTFKVMGTHKALTSADDARRAGKPIPVSMTDVRQEKINQVLGAECRTVPYVSVSLASSLGTQVARVTADVGETVAKDQELVEFDAKTYESAHKAAKEQVVAATSRFRDVKPFLKKLKTLYDQGVVALDGYLSVIQDVGRARAELASARGIVAQTERNLTATKIVSPIDGVVTFRGIEVGATPAPHTVLMIVSQLDPIKLECSFTEQHYKEVVLDQEADVSFYAYPGRTYKGLVETITPAIDEEKGVFNVLLKIDNPDLDLVPGMNGVARFESSEEMLRIPATSLINRDNEVSTVFVVDAEDVAHLRQVQTGLYGEGYVGISEGLSEGERVVVMGQVGLRTGDRVLGSDEVLSQTKSYKYAIPE